MPEAPIIFLGPSLPLEMARAILPGADFRPPIRRGDLLGISPDSTSSVGIIDGVFFQGLAISPKEILPLLRKGVRVWGASSMGALRAVELMGHGMTGVGRIFERFRSGRLIADDEVALTFDPETLRPVSEPLVNIRFALSAARAAGLISLAELIGLTRAMTGIYFPDRTRERFLVEARRRLGSERAAQLQAGWLHSSPDVKGEDATMLLRMMAGGA